MNQGWTLIDTSRFFNYPVSFDAPGKDDFRLYIYDGRSKVNGHRPTHGYFDRNAGISPNRFEKLGDFLDSLLRHALPKEKFHFAHMEGRLYDPSRPRDEYGKWHLDGGYLRAITSISGSPTEFLSEKDELSIPPKWTLIFTGTDRAYVTKIKATYHRTPKFDKVRQILVTTYHQAFNYF